MVVSRNEGKAVSLACYGELAELAECACLLDGWPPTCGPWVRIPHSPSGNTRVDSSARLKVLGSEGSLVAGSIPAVPI